MKPSLRRKKGAALVLTLLVVIIMTTITVALFVAMRMERSSAAHYVGRAHADFMAQEGVQVACNLLSDAFRKSTAAAPVAVVTMPGRLYTNASGTNWQMVELSSGLASGYSPSGRTVASPIDLNRAVRSADNLPLIDPNGGPMPVNWIYVLKDGTRTDTLPAPLSISNPVIGRYAFWTDDESTRVNLDTAWQQGNSNTWAHPSQIALASVIPTIGTQAGTTNGVFSTAPLQTVQEAALRLPNVQSISNLVSSNRFYLTTYNHSSSLNPWGEPKIYLTTQISNIPSQFANLQRRTDPNTPALGQCSSDYFLDICTGTNADPGRASALSNANLNIQLQRLTGLLSRTNWPIAPGVSFASKYKSYDPSRVTQMALDIIEYVRAAETTNPAVSMIRTALNGGIYDNTQTLLTTTFVGTGRHPLINEVGLWVSATTNAAGYYQGQCEVEVYLPPHYGLTNYDVSGDQIDVQLNGRTAFPVTTIASSSTNPIPAGSLAVLTSPLFDLKATNGAGVFVPTIPAGSRTTTTSIRLRVALDTKAGELYEVVPKQNVIVLPLDSTNVAYANIGSAEVIDDPRLNKVTNDWVIRGTNSFGHFNSQWKQSLRVGEQDLDGGTYSETNSLFMPALKKQNGNPDGMVHSVAELGRIATGVENDDDEGNQGVNWRTVRLQPSTNGNLPDWALLDLFSAPIRADTNKVYFPTTNSIAGRVNMNEWVQPFGTNYKLPVFNALLTNAAASLSATTLTNIRNHTLAANGRAFGTTNFYKSPGEIAEIAGVADAGESSEANLLPIVNLATTSSDVFRIYATGQTLIQNPSGQLFIEATKSVEAVVERQGTGTSTVFTPVSWSETPF